LNLGSVTGQKRPSAEISQAEIAFGHLLPEGQTPNSLGMIEIPALADFVDFSFCSGSNPLTWAQDTRSGGYHPTIRTSHSMRAFRIHPLL
jgi:hypothetical protein